MPKVHILYVITKLELGGAQAQVLSLLRHINKEEFAPFLFTAREGLLIDEACGLDSVRVEKSRFLERNIHPCKDILALAEIFWYIKKNGIRIVHTHSSKAGILGRAAAKLAGVPVIIHTVHGWSFNDFQAVFKKNFFIWLERIVARFTSALVVVSRYDRDKGLACRIGRESQYQLIRYNIDFEAFEKKGSALRKELGVKDADLIVGMVACFKPQKSPCDFVQLAHVVHQSMPGVKFVLVGDGVLRTRIEQRIAALGLGECVILAGWRRDMPEVLASLDVLVLTSLWEGLPIVVLEAMASLRPVVATSTGGIAEVVIDSKTGFLVGPQDTDAMAQKVMLLLRDPGLRSELAHNARENLSHDFRLPGMVQATTDLYCRLLRGEYAA